MFDRHPFRESAVTPISSVTRPTLATPTSAYVYRGHHPLDPSHGGGFYMDWVHNHWFAPFSVSFSWNAGAYVWGGGWDPGYYSNRALLRELLWRLLPHHYLGGRYYSHRPAHTRTWAGAGIAAGAALPALWLRLAATGLRRVPTVRRSIARRAMRRRCITARRCIRPRSIALRSIRPRSIVRRCTRPRSTERRCSSAGLPRSDAAGAGLSRRCSKRRSIARRCTRLRCTTRRCTRLRPSAVASHAAWRVGSIMLAAFAAGAPPSGVPAASPTSA